MHHESQNYGQAPTNSLNGHHKKNLIIILIILVAALVVLAAIALAAWWANENLVDKNLTNSSVASKESGASANNPETQGLQLDSTKNYGDKYKTGILPVGDKNYTTSGAEKGKIYLCNASFVNEGQAGATQRGPWFVGTAQWDINKKYSVKGNVKWQQSISVDLQNGRRVITTNNLPDHETGTFPVAASDPAYAYDRNPNSIKSQSFTYDLAASPTYGSPKCMGGEVGVMLTGVALFNGFDAGGRDAGAWEIQDGCEGHPQSSGTYHYHTLSSCIKDTGISTVIGFALDGFPVTGPKVSEGNYLTTNDLDECHGIVSEVILDGKSVKTYHYVMTQDFPYSASCFRSTASQPPGQHTGGQQMPQGQTPPPKQ